MEVVLEGGGGGVRGGGDGGGGEGGGGRGSGGGFWRAPAALHFSIQYGEEKIKSHGNSTSAAQKSPPVERKGARTGPGGGHVKNPQKKGQMLG